MLHPGTWPPEEGNGGTPSAPAAARAGVEAGGPALAHRIHRRSGPLLVGIGNVLRGDDGVGARLATRAGRLLRTGSRRGLTVLRVQQLTPELAEELSHCSAVLFIDAWMAPEGAVPERIRLEPAGLEEGSHRLDAAGLLMISAALYGRAPEAELLRVPGHAFGHGGDLSAPLRAQWPRAERLLRDWLERHA